MAKVKHKASAIEISNDPSLKYHSYCKWEMLWSDLHNKALRFSHYADSDRDMIFLATVNGIEELVEAVPVLSVRRQVHAPRPAANQAEREAMMTHQKLCRTRRTT